MSDWGPIIFPTGVGPVLFDGGDGCHYRVLGGRRWQPVAWRPAFAEISDEVAP